MNLNYFNDDLVFIKNLPDCMLFQINKNQSIQINAFLKLFNILLKKL